jgi:hypothetical protein
MFAVTVGVMVTVLWVPTVREKSLSYAIGSAFPLLEIIITDHAPVVNWVLFRGL